MNENACIIYAQSSNLILAWALENVDLKRVMSATVSIATLTWHDLELNMLDEQYLAVVPMANLILCFELNFSYLRKKSVMYVQNSIFDWN